MIWGHFKLLHSLLQRKRRKESILKDVPAFSSILPAFLCNLSTFSEGRLRDIRFELCNMEKQKITRFCQNYSKHKVRLDSRNLFRLKG